MRKCDLIIENAAQLLTCASGGQPKKAASLADVGLMKNGALAIGGAKILAVGETGDIRRDFQAENVVDARGKTVAPGFVDCHTHIVFAGDRLDEFEMKIKGADYLEILRAGGGINSTVEKTRKADASELGAQSKNRLDEMLKNGTTAAEVKTGYGLDVATEFKMLDVIARLDKTHAMDLVPTFLAAHAVPPEYRGESDEFTRLICEEMLPLAAEWFAASHFATENTAFFCDVFCEKNAFDLGQSRRVLERAKKLGFGLKAHVDEFTNLGGARMAIELGAASVDHLDATSDEEIKLLAASDTIAVVTPTVNFNFGARDFADARKLIDAGCAIAVSTDFNPGSAPCPSLPMAMAIGCRYQKMTPAEAFNAATINAAFAIGKGKVVGSLETGKKADFVIFDTRDYRQIAYEFGANFVGKVFKNGKVVLGNE